MKIVFTSHFKRKYKKRVLISTDLHQKAVEKLTIFEKTPEHASLENHALKGSLKGYRAITLGYDLRAIFRYEKETNTAFFFDIGTHDQVY